MLEGIVERAYEQREYLRREFQAIGEPQGCGFSFDCYPDGSVLESNPAQLENFAFAIAHPEKFQDLGVTTKVYEHVVPAHGTCRCGETVYLVDQYLGACECPRCGQWYNLFGQELIAPEMWEEDRDFY